MAAHSLLFGTAGIPHLAPKNSSISGIEFLRERGLEAMELEFVQRVSMGAQTASQVRRTAVQHRVRLSAHAPYYINLNSRDPEKLRASGDRLLRAARVASACGARNVVFHVGYYHEDTPDQAYERIAEQLRRIVQQVHAEGLDVILRPETAGRVAQFGDLREILQLCTDVEGLLPCIDFAHLHARSAGAVGAAAAGWNGILDHVRNALGPRGLGDVHLHVQGIAYNKSGERRHQNLAESDLDYRGLLLALRDHGVQGTLICESPNLEEDALLLQEEYRTLAAQVSVDMAGGQSSVDSYVMVEEQ